MAYSLFKWRWIRVKLQEQAKEADYVRNELKDLKESNDSVLQEIAELRKSLQADCKGGW